MIDQPCEFDPATDSCIVHGTAACRVAPIEPFDSIPDECKPPHQRSEIGRRRSGDSTVLRGVMAPRYQPARRAEPARSRSLYAPAAIGTIATLLALLGVGIALLGAWIGWL